MLGLFRLVIFSRCLFRGLYISNCFIIFCKEAFIQFKVKGSRRITMTERQWGARSELGERRFEDQEFIGVEEIVANEISPETDLLKHFAMAGGVTHEEVLLLLASPDDIEEALRVSGIRHSGTDRPSLTRLLGWSDRNRRLKVMSRSADPESIARDISQGAQGIGLIRGGCCAAWPAAGGLHGVVEFAERREERSVEAETYHAVDDLLGVGVSGGGWS